MSRVPPPDAILSLMLWLALWLILGGEGEAPEGRLLQLHGRGFSFEVLEPEGWVLDTESAPQIANFIFHPRGVNWRRADAVIYARFTPRRLGEPLDSFLEENRRNFYSTCPGGADSRVEALEAAPFQVFRFDCTGSRTELVAFAEFPGYFVIFALAGRDAAAVAPGESTLRAILQSFRWTTLPRDLFRRPATP
ncbi:MAG: hypothetical protein Kow001_00480 [Acidobacteriota bacterium]